MLFVAKSQMLTQDLIPRLTRRAAVPAERASWPPLPGFISTLCNAVPMGMAESGKLLPILMLAPGPDVTESPGTIFCGARMYANRSELPP